MAQPDSSLHFQSERNKDLGSGIRGRRWFRFSAGVSMGVTARQVTAWHGGVKACAAHVLSCHTTRCMLLWRLVSNEKQTCWKWNNYSSLLTLLLLDFTFHSLLLRVKSTLHINEKRLAIKNVDVWWAGMRMRVLPPLVGHMTSDVC